MSKKRPGPMQPQQGRGNQQIRNNQSMRTNNLKRKPMRIGWIAPIVLAVIVVGVALAMHFSSSRSSSSATSASVSQVNPRMGTPQAVGLAAPNGTLTTVGGKTISVASLAGKPTLIWFVATWCSSCQAGTQALAANVSKLSADGVRVVEVELYKDLGQPGNNFINSTHQHLLEPGTEQPLAILRLRTTKIPTTAAKATTNPPTTPNVATPIEPRAKTRKGPPQHRTGSNSIR